MYFPIKQREEKKRRNEQIKRQHEKTQQITRELRDAEARLKEKESILSKSISDIDNDTDQKGTFLRKLKQGLSKTKHLLVGSLRELSSADQVDGDFLEDLEEQLLGADLGYVTTEKIIELIRKKVSDQKVRTRSEVITAVQDIITAILDCGNCIPPHASLGPTVFLFVGVNGVGKTTSIGKIAARYKEEGARVLVAAGDTFRAAAIEQLEEWCKRAEVDIVANKINSDPAATVFEAASKAVAEKYDILLCDTSGRLHTKKNLMNELLKIRKVIQKIIPTGPHASILVLDANTGQNAIPQTKEFSTALGLDGLIVTKLDGTAKGGVIIGIINELEIPVYYVGVGEGLNDLQNFSPRVFAESLFEEVH